MTRLIHYQGVVVNTIGRKMVHVLVIGKKLHYIDLLVYPFLLKPGNTGICPNSLINSPVNMAAGITESIELIITLVFAGATKATLHIVQLPFAVQNSFYFIQGFSAEINIVRCRDAVCFITTANGNSDNGNSDHKKQEFVHNRDGVDLCCA